MIDELMLQRRLRRAWSIDQLNDLARQYLPRAIHDFFEGGAEDELTLRANHQAFAAQSFLPRVLVGAEDVDTEVTLFGQRSSLPLAIAPIGGAGAARPNADLALARAAAAAGIPYTLSTMSAVSIEEVARQAPGRLWFQAYMLRDRQIVQRLVERARGAGYEALVVTVDLPAGGKRERDLSNHFAMQYRHSLSNTIDFLRHPRWLTHMLWHGRPALANLVEMDDSQAVTGRAASSVGRFTDPSFDWSQLRQLRDSWPLPLIIKGILHPEDAAQAVAVGCDAIVVSNHGGRQLDGAVTSLDALPAVVARVGGRIPVLVDGGVRRGSDVVKAVAMGASAVMVGRAVLFGAAAAGEPGAQLALQILRDEIERTMRLCGVCTVGEIQSSRVLAASQQ